MLYFCNKLESLIRILYIKIKLLYYKTKYGNRLTLGKHIRFRKGFRIYIDKNGKVEIGNNVFFNRDCTIDAFYKISIDDDNLFGENVKIYDHNHIFNNKEIKRGNNFFGKEIKIGKNNWFGSNVVILSGSVIGENNVLGTGNIINNNIANDSIARLSEDIYKIEKIRYKE